jgi:hypothetical protein
VLRRGIQEAGDYINSCYVYQGCPIYYEGITTIAGGQDLRERGDCDEGAD